MEAEPGELSGRYVPADCPAVGCLPEHVLKKFFLVLVGARAVRGRGDRAAVVPVHHGGVDAQDLLELMPGIAPGIPDCMELLQFAGHLAVMLGQED